MSNKGKLTLKLRATNLTPSATLVEANTYREGEFLWKIVRNKRVANREFQVGCALPKELGFVPSLDLFVEHRYLLKQKFLAGATLYQVIKDPERSVPSLLVLLPKLLRKVFLLLEKHQDTFTHYDLSIHNVLIQDEEIYLIDFEYSYCAQLTPCSETQEYNVSVTSVVQGTVTPMICDPYIDLIVLLTSFLEAWTTLHPTFAQYFKALESRCVQYFESVGFHVQSDPRFVEKTRYLASSEEYEALVKSKPIRRLSRSSCTLPIFSAEDLKPLSFQALLVQLEDKRWDVKGRSSTKLESVQLCSLLVQFKKHNLAKLKVSAMEFRNTILKYVTQTADYYEKTCHLKLPVCHDTPGRPC